MKDPLYPAHPTPVGCVPGMTYRQWLAGIAMQAFISNPHGEYCDSGFDKLADWSVGAALAVEAALKKEGNE